MNCVIMDFLGYFTKEEIDGIKQNFEGKTYMKFHISASNNAGNYILTVGTDYTDDGREIGDFFMHCALAKLRDMKPVKHKYTVWATREVYCYVQVEASSEEEARDIAENMDVCEFINDSTSEDFRILDDADAITCDD